MSGSFKEQLIEICRLRIESKRDNLQHLINSARESANSETKSSAGDKHETARALAQLEQENLAKQIAVVGQLEASLNQINAKTGYKKVENGALVRTDKLMVLFGVSLGEVKIDSTVVFSVSISSPIGIAARGKLVGDSFSVNGVTHTIKRID